MARGLSLPELLRRGAKTALEAGPAAVITRGRPVVRRRRNRLGKRLLARAGGIPAARAYLRACRLCSPAAITDADPFRRLWVDPASITKQVESPTKRWGRVAGGDWDQNVVPIAETQAYQSTVAHFEAGVPWTETEEFEAYRRRLEAGTQPKGCDTEAELADRFDELDTVYERIVAEGYRSQTQLWEERPDSQQALFYKWDRTVDPRLDEVTVSIARDGTLLHSNRGEHRLAMAKLLSLRSIPVLVRRRHTDWQSIRTAIAVAANLSDLDDRMRTHIDHPDIRAPSLVDQSANDIGSPATAATRVDGQ